MSLHIDLKESIEAHYPDQLDGEIQLKQDALLVMFDSGLALELRYLNPHEYSIQWAWGDAELRIDTAPLHKELSTFPNHLHNADGHLLPDLLTVPGRAPWDNVKQLIDALLLDPLLESARLNVT
ncbi:toxin-antitoxin system TumE family protein [Sulfurirhabdus autotrophica]|uniref:Uncharacterized protein n=1 Tax=Sulfurirhabdus autotrophica TaxID=1706046 RepID=A0A4R3XZI7_9PROT|nr:DUF6516 family protein [Sulfurirhabdus autotrophica]TCV83274.1 hypothetical protein EDC63_11624 [Sulfurirhabdus autotrophica]